MNDVTGLFPESAGIVAGAPEAERVNYAGVPAKAAVYLLTTTTDVAGDHPVLLATVGDLRAALKRRLGDSPAEGKTKRVEYGKLCTRVHYRVVHSAFAANFYYAEAARKLFPETAAGLIPWRTSWWVAVEKAGVTATPRFRKTNVLTDAGLRYAGPVRDKHAAQRLVETLEDLFDLCRYHHILVQAPHGKACAYKEMGKCPAPCDGSIGLGEYGRQIEEAAGFLTNRAEAGGRLPREVWREKLEGEMRAAAGALKFERAGKIKQRISRAGLVETEPFLEMAGLEEFGFLTLQPGKGKPWVEPWVVHFGGKPSVQALPQFNVKEVGAAAEHLAGQCRLLMEVGGPGALTAEQTADAGLVAHHLFRGEAEHGVWLRLREAVEAGAIVKAVEKLKARKAPAVVAEQATDAVGGAGEAAPESATDGHG